MDERNRARRKPLGKAIQRSDEELDRLSQIQAGDIERAKVEATEDLRRLLDAEPLEEDDGDTGTAQK